MIILQTKKIKKYFGGVHAVDDVSIKINKGDITGIIGPNGSGKTTFINLLSGMSAIDKGYVILNGIKKFKKIKSSQISSYGITRTFQNIRLFGQMTVLDNILVVLTGRNIFLSLFKNNKEECIKKAEEVLYRVGLLEKRDQLVVNLSYGQRKLLEIARAMAMRAEIYLLDEPFSGLFPQMLDAVSAIIKELKQEGKTIILIDHNMDLIRKLCDYIFVMDDGKVIAEGKPEKVLSDKKVIEAYLGE